MLNETNLKMPQKHFLQEEICHLKIKFKFEPHYLLLDIWLYV